MIAPALFGHAVPATPGDLWSAWGRDPAVLVGLCAFVLAYAAGLAAASGRPSIHAVVRRRAWAAGGAVLALVAALVSPLDVAARALFSAHMAQHLLLAAVAAPLLVLSAPVPTVRRALAPRWRRTLLAATRWRIVRAGRRPWWVAVATTVSLATMSLWHAPALYDAALSSHAVHAVEHGTILGTAIVAWAAVVGAVRRSQRLVAVAALAVATFHGASLGGLLALAPRPWYSSHAETATAWGVDALGDQQVAGALMWVPAGVVYLGAVAWILYGALDTEGGSRSPPNPPDPPHGDAARRGAERGAVSPLPSGSPSR